MAMAICLLVTATAGVAETPREALAHAVRGTAASGAVLDWRTGVVLAQVGPETRAVPGSAVKPLVLEWALEHGVVNAGTTVYCRRTLRVGTRELRCTHPAEQPMIDAETALAESCNTWFAELGKRLTGAQLDAALAGLHHERFASAAVEERELGVLGLSGVSATPLELARAYRATLLRLKATDTVSRGLHGSVAFGMARGAGVKGLDIMGKTGTASEPGQTTPHGWFAGALPGKFVVVFYVPRGDGGVASGLAHAFFEASK